MLGDLIPTEITPRLLDQATICGTLFFALLAAILRWFKGGAFFAGERFALDLFNAASIVPLMAFIGGTFNEALRQTVAQSNNILIVLAAGMALYFVIRHLFKTEP